MRSSAVMLLVAMVFTAAAQVHPRDVAKPVDLSRLPVHPAATGAGDAPETLEVYYSPLPSTAVIRYVGLGMAYHMAIVYTDRTGTSFGASSGPSNLAAPQTPASATQALVAIATDTPSSFGVLRSDPHNDRPFVIGRDGDVYTHGRDGERYPHASMMTGRDLSAQWTMILRTYAIADSQDLPYSPVTQNSNSLAGTALRRIGIAGTRASGAVFAPGVFDDLSLPGPSTPKPAPDSGFMMPGASPSASAEGATVM